VLATEDVKKGAEEPAACSNAACCWGGVGWKKEDGYDLGLKLP